MWSTAAGIVSMLVAITGLFFTWRRVREDALRRSEVLAWSNEGIEALAEIASACRFAHSHLTDEQVRERLVRLMFSTSALIERGRLFFKNAPDPHGAEKPEAYRGIRPVILDCLVIGHEVAVAWPSADAETRRRLCIVILDALREFVSCAQREVGRTVVREPSNRKGGDGVRLQLLIDEISAERIDEFERRWLSRITANSAA